MYLSSRGTRDPSHLGGPRHPKFPAVRDIISKSIKNRRPAEKKKKGPRRRVFVASAALCAAG